MSIFWNPDLQNLSPYIPGEQPKHEKLVKLNTNESPYGPSPKALAAIAAGNHEGLRLYPDPDAKELKEAIAKHYGLEPNQVFVGNGSDEVLAHVFLGLLKHPKPLLFPDRYGRGALASVYLLYGRNAVSLNWYDSGQL